MSKLILVTGGTGFIGSHTVVELQQAGFDVVIIDDLSNSKAEVVDNIEKITGIRPAFECFDIADREKTHAFFKKYTNVEAIIHFAAFKAVGESVQKPLEYYRNNLTALMNLLECMKEYGTHHLVFSSSCTVYGQPDKLPVTEATPRKPAESPYGNTKAVCEDIIRDYCKANADINGIALRYFNPIGAHKSGLIGEGEDIPYSKFAVKEKEYGEITIEKYAKAVSIEAIKDHGYGNAVAMTDDEFLFQHQTDVTGRFYTYLNTGTLTVEGADTFQMALAMAKGRVLNKFKQILNQ